MRLPIPNSKAVEEFRQLCQREFGIELSEAEALRYATRLLQLFYVKNYGIHPLCPPDERESGDKSKQ